MLYVNGSSTQPAKLDAVNKQDLISHIYDNNRACWVLKFTSGKFAHILKTLVSNNTITSITLPEGLTSIGKSAFSRCWKLTSITIPNGVTSIGSSAFYECSNLKSIILGNSVASIEDEVFSGCNLTSITIPESVTSIGEYAFYGCNSLISVAITSRRVTSIGYGAFNGCSLISVVCKSSTPPNIENMGSTWCISHSGFGLRGRR